MSIKPTYTTMGQASPASVSVDAGDGEGGYYRWRKLPGWVPNDPRCRKGDGRPAEPSPQNATAMTARAKRLAEFKRLQLAEKLTKEQAADRLGISRSTMQAYVREIREQQRAAAP